MRFLILEVTIPMDDDANAHAVLADRIDAQDRVAVVGLDDHFYHYGRLTGAKESHT